MFTLYWPDFTVNELELDTFVYVSGVIVIPGRLMVVSELSGEFSKQTVATLNVVETSLPCFRIGTLSNTNYVVPTTCSECKDQDLNVVVYSRSMYYSLPTRNYRFCHLDKVAAHFGAACKRSRLPKLPIDILNSLYLKKMCNGKDVCCRSDKLTTAQLYESNPLNDTKRYGEVVYNLKQKLQTRFQNPIVYLDALLGTLVGMLLLTNCDSICSEGPKSVLLAAVTSYEMLIQWLMGWPAGLKLNNNLNKFLGEMFLWMLNLWSYLLLPALQPNIWRLFIFYTIVLSLCGLSTFFALLCDLLRLLTVHLRFIEFIATKIYRFQAYLLFTLFQLFRGKKWNTLRQRYDAADYDPEQLLIGTILFTILTYLFPTVLVYYLPFAATKKSIGCLLSFFNVLQRAVLCFPMQLVGKAQQPHSIRFCTLPTGSHSKVRYFYLESILKGRFAILKDYVYQITK